MLVINADDWGASETTTDTIRECLDSKVVDTVSAMVFMSDSERAADIALDNGIETALHINFTTPFDGNVESHKLVDSQNRIVKYLGSSKAARFIYNPFLKNGFEHVFKAQCEKYLRLYKVLPARMDGHNHMHLCANMLLCDIVPRDIRFRRNNSFVRGEKNFLNITYRAFIDRLLQRRFMCTDYFFHIQQISRKENPARFQALRKLIMLAQTKTIELLAHPHQNFDYNYLMSVEFMTAIAQVPRGNFDTVVRL